MAELSINSLSFVLNGDFNPSIFQPAWFSSQKLISESEAEAISDLTVVQRDLVRFKLPWLDFQVLQQQLSATTSKESHFLALGDFVLGTLRILRHTPVRQIGINLIRHYRMENEEKWNEFGHVLAPKKKWSSVMQNPGLASMSMVDKELRKFESGHKATTRINIEGSLVIKNGIHVLVNSHFECGNSSGIPGASGAIDILEKDFTETIKFSTESTDVLINSYDKSNEKPGS